MGQIYVSHPGEAIIITGGCMAPQSKRTVIGSWSWAFWGVSHVQYISLGLMTLLPRCQNVETSLGVPITINAVCQCKIMRDETYFKLAAEQFLGFTVDEIKYALQCTLEGHLRAVAGTLTVEELYKDRIKLSQSIKEVAGADICNMGVEIVSFTITDISDGVGYLSAIGKTQTALVKRDAAIGIAQSNRDAGMKEAESERQAESIKYEKKSQICENQQKCNQQKFQFKKEIHAVQAEVSLAYELRTTVLQQTLKETEIQLLYIEKKKSVEVETHESIRKELELISLVKLPADAEYFRVGKIAEAHKTMAVLSALAEAERTKLLGDADGYRISTIGEAEAQRMSKRAKAFKNYKKAAILSMTLEILPDLAGKISSPLSKTEEILFLGSSDTISGVVNRFIAEIPKAIRVVNGIDVIPKDSTNSKYNRKTS